MRNNITKYLKKTVLAQVDRSIDFKKENFHKISKENFKEGIIDPNITLNLFEENKKEKTKYIKSEQTPENIDESIYVILAVKVIKTEVEGSQKKDELDDLTGLFFVPALLNKKTSSLLPSIEDNKLPWFPREFLSPMIEPELAIGYVEKYENIISDEIYNIYKITNWEDYIEYCKRIYEQTTTCDFDSDEICNINKKNEIISLENNVYIFLDNTINSTFYIKKLYSDIEKQEIALPLYENFISLNENENKELIKNTIENRKKHYGQMGGKFGLSPSQREGLNHFQNCENGEILAIQGPPGTGKTTLLQSIVATQYVKSALKKDVPPLIVATSTNNQAVTNIIDSFGKITTTFNNNLGIRWIEKVNSFATYFPSKAREKDAKKKGFQYTNNRGDHFVSEVENENNIMASKEKFLKQAGILFKTPENTNIRIYREKLHKKLLELDELKNELIDIAQKIQNQIGDANPLEFAYMQQEHIKNLEQKSEEILKRVEFWRHKYNEIPYIWKILSWLQKYKLKISNRLKLFAKEDEEFGQNILNMDFIEEYYAIKQENNNKEIRIAKHKLEKLESDINIYRKIIDNFQECFVNTTDLKDKFIIDTDKLDEWLDKNVRYVSFWIAVHYYEARWLEGECKLTPNQKGTNFSNVLVDFYKRLRMITPCLVMTFYRLPGQFEAYIENDTRKFLYNLIDILIVDEAGQVSTEIAACSFALAKKALVVGDDKQIEPVWGIDIPLDKSLAIQEKVIPNENDFYLLEQYGITASNSSVMKVACKSSFYSKYNEKGLFLREHRRCFNDIIEYCNALVYFGNLLALRGNGNSNSLLPKMGYYFVETDKSKKVGTSRINTNEAVHIANWILKNAETIFEYYKQLAKHDNKNPDDVDLSKIIGIVTPFKEQVKEIKNVLKKILPENLFNKVTLGTVHTFQGGERKIIIMSTTYGHKDGCFFIDHKKNLMNVAVSRAEDSFLVFGDINCLKDERTSPSGLLKEYIVGSCINQKN